MSNSHTLRKQRTRTLIQLGGLIEKSGLLDQFAISLGQDLQKDEEAHDEVMVLLGALTSLVHEMERGDYSRELWKERGVQCMRQESDQG
jgi:hypothetical protein